jgi:hypothetical protein
MMTIPNLLYIMAPIDPAADSENSIVLSPTMIPINHLNFFKDSRTRGYFMDINEW